jgi:hypothetical protein
MSTLSLVWVRIGEDEPLLVEEKDLTFGEAVVTEDDLSLWDTELIDTPTPPIIPLKGLERKAEPTSAIPHPTART